MAEHSAADPSIAYAFGPFRLIPARALLLNNDTPSSLGSRAMGILLALVERPGETVTKQALLDRAWPNTFVHEANLRVHITALRKALGDGQAGARYIVNVMGRGYCFVAPVQRLDPLVLPQPDGHRSDNLPAALTRVIGRAEIVEAIALQVPMRRCVSIVGPGGIGKTTVAVAVAERLLPVYDDGVWFVDLSAVSQPQFVPLAIAAVLDLSVPAAEPASGLAAFLRDRQGLLLLDNCEHVIDTVAPLAETLLRAAPRLGILATSRETLRVSGEWLYRLGPLESPLENETFTGAQALRFPAVQLFVECAAASLEGFELNDGDVPAVAALCRRLDGLPLAIELAAARIDLFGLHGLATALDDQFLLVAGGRRTALPRQQSLLHTLDWSYRLLSPMEQTVLRRLAVFRGDFTLEAAVAVAVGDGVDSEQVYAGVLTLTAKSLLATDISGAREHYHRLLHVTAAFIAHQPDGPHTDTPILRRHAEYLCRLLEQAAADWEEIMFRSLWLDIYARAIEDVRAALDWAFSRQGDAGLGIALTAAALPLGFQLSLIDEFRDRVERALLHAGRVQPPQPLAEMRLNMALGQLTQNTAEPIPGRSAGFERAIALSQELDGVAYQVAPLIGLAGTHLGAGDYAAAVEVADRASAVAEAAREPLATLVADRVSAQAHHFHGDHTAARRRAQAVLDHPAKRIPLAYSLLPVDRQVSMRIVLARVAWLEGFPERAVAIVRKAIHLARSDSAFSLCQALALAAIPIAIWTGDDSSADAFTCTLGEQASRYTLAHWLGWATSFRSLLRLRAGEVGPVPARSGTLQLDTFTTLSQELLTVATAQRAQTDAAGWCRAEILRAQGEWLLAEGTPQAAQTAESLFHAARAIAQGQGALSWDLRAAMSLARLWRQNGRAAAAGHMLRQILDRFTEGRGTADLSEAAALLNALETTGSDGRGLRTGAIRVRSQLRQR